MAPASALCEPGEKKGDAASCVPAASPFLSEKSPVAVATQSYCHLFRAGTNDAFRVQREACQARDVRANLGWSARQRLRNRPEHDLTLGHALRRLALRDQRLCVGEEGYPEEAVVLGHRRAQRTNGFNVPESDGPVRARCDESAVRAELRLHDSFAVMSQRWALRLARGRVPQLHLKGAHACQQGAAVLAALDAPLGVGDPPAFRGLE